MEKYELKSWVTGTQMSALNLPIDSIFENGVYYVSEKNSSYYDDVDQLEHHIVMVKFDYKDDHGNIQHCELPRNIFEQYFTKSN